MRKAKYDSETFVSYIPGKLQGGDKLDFISQWQPVSILCQGTNLSKVADEIT